MTAVPSSPTPVNARSTAPSGSAAPATPATPATSRAPGGRRRGAPAWDEGELRTAVATLAQLADGDEPVDQLAHALQCATHAMAAGSSPELVAAALLHDIGRAPQVCAAFPGLPHETAGARWVGPRTSEKVAWLVEAHVPAKVYLVETDPTYFACLSPGSVYSLGFQGAERGHHPPMEELAAHPWWPEALDLRRWDDAAKVPGATAATVDEIFDQLRPAFAPGGQNGQGHDLE